MAPPVFPTTAIGVKRFNGKNALFRALFRSLPGLL